MILKIAWRNVWRNPMRSFVVMGAIVVGVWSVIFLMSMMFGMIDSYVENVIDNEISHIQIHHKEFPKEKESKYFMENADNILVACEDIEGIKAMSTRSLTNAMIASGRGTRGIRVSGIDPEREKNVSAISKKMVEGDYLSEDKRNPVLISESLAKKLKIKMRSKIVLTFQRLDGEITAGAFRVNGIFDSGDNLYDESIVFVRQNDLNGLLGKEGIGHEAAFYLEDINMVDTIKNQIAAKFPNLLVQSYKEISPELELFESQLQMASGIYMIIFMLALIFGIINTMLMTVLERVRELGMLMSVGMNKLRVFLMIVLETLLLAAISAPVGLLIGYITTIYFGKNGINLSIFSKEGMEQFGMSTFIYPSVDPGIFLQLAFAVSITALLASLYPAYKAIKLKPVEAIRKL